MKTSATTAPATLLATLGKMALAGVGGQTAAAIGTAGLAGLLGSVQAKVIVGVLAGAIAVGGYAVVKRSSATSPAGTPALVSAMAGTPTGQVSGASTLPRRS